MQTYLTDQNQNVSATGYGLDDRGSIPDRCRIFSAPQRSVLLCGSPSFLSIN